MPRQLLRGEYYLLPAILTTITYVACNQALGGMWVAASTTAAFVVGFGFRLLSQFLGWGEWEPWKPAGAASEKAHAALRVGLKAEFERSVPTAEPEKKI